MSPSKEDIRKCGTVTGAVSVWHVVPVNDTYEHEDSSECWCCPTVDDDTPPGTLLVIHNSYDEREKFETGERKAS